MTRYSKSLSSIKVTLRGSRWAGIWKTYYLVQGEEHKCFLISMTKLFSSSQTPPSNPSPLPRLLPCGMKSGVSWRAGSYCPRLRMRRLRKWTYEQKGVFSQCPHEILQSLPCHVPTPWLSLCQPLLASVLWSQKDCHLALPRRLNSHVSLPIPGISMAQHRSWVSKSQRESFLALLLTPGVLVRVPLPSLSSLLPTSCLPPRDLFILLVL